jgi:hypothetical protein
LASDIPRRRHADDGDQQTTGRNALSDQSAMWSLRALQRADPGEHLPAGYGGHGLDTGSNKREDGAGGENVLGSAFAAAVQEVSQQRARHDGDRGRTQLRS